MVSTKRSAGWSQASRALRTAGTSLAAPSRSRCGAPPRPGSAGPRHRERAPPRSARRRPRSASLPRSSRRRGRGGGPPAPTAARSARSRTRARGPRRERVDERRLPGAGTGGREEVHPTVGPEDAAHAVEARASELRELRPAMVDGGASDGLQHPPGDVGGPRDLQEMASCPVAHAHSSNRRNPVRMIGAPGRRFIRGGQPRVSPWSTGATARDADRPPPASRRQSAWRRISRWVRPRYSVR